MTNTEARINELNRAKKELHAHLRESENPDYRRGISNCVRILMQRRRELSQVLKVRRVVRAEAR